MIGTALLAMLAALAGCSGASEERTGPCADLARALRDRPASELNRLAAPANTESFQRELGVRSRSRSGAQNTHREDDPLTALELFAGRENKPEADLVFIAYADGQMRYLGCADVTPAEPAKLSVQDARPGQDAVFLIDPVWIAGRPYNKPSVLDYLPVSAGEPATGRFFGGKEGLLPPLLAPVVTDTGVELQKLEGECGAKCLDVGLLVTDLTGEDGRIRAKTVATRVVPRPTTPEASASAPSQPVHTARVAIVFGGSGQNLYPQQDWHVRPAAGS